MHLVFIVHVLQKFAKLRMFDIHVEIRDMNQYTDIHITTSPITLTVPILERRDSEFLALFYPTHQPHLRLEGIFISK